MTTDVRASRAASSEVIPTDRSASFSTWALSPLRWTVAGSSATPLDQIDQASPDQDLLPRSGPLPADPGGPAPVARASKASWPSATQSGGIQPRLRYPQPWIVLVPGRPFCSSLPKISMKLAPSGPALKGTVRDVRRHHYHLPCGERHAFDIDRTFKDYRRRPTWMGVPQAWGSVRVHLRMNKARGVLVIVLADHQREEGGYLVAWGSVRTSIFVPVDNAQTWSGKQRVHFRR